MPDSPTASYAGENPPAAPDDCEHYWASHVRGGEPVAVRICRLCGAIDWDDLRVEVARVVDAICSGKC